MLRRTTAAVAVVLALVLALGLGATACSGSEEGSLSITDGASATAAPEAGSSLSPEDFAAAARIPGTVILDVRTPEEYAEGHLEGAVLIDLQDQAGFAEKVAALDPAGTYAVYCRSGNRSAVAMEQLAQRGFESYYDLAGGIESWTDSGGAVVTD